MTFRSSSASFAAPGVILDDRTESENLRLGKLSFTRTQFTRLMIGVSAIVAITTLYLNYHSALLGGILHRFENQADIIKHGFDPHLAIDRSTLTYPMWGYGWLYVLTDNRLALMSLQVLLGLAAGVLFVRVLTRATSDSVLLIVGTLFAISAPWFSLHSTITLYSPSSSLLACSIALLVASTSQTSKAMALTVVSGVLFGLCLNFRSDYILMPIGLAAIVVMCGRDWYSMKCMVVWGISIMIMIVPWSLYTWHVVGVPRVTSTNGGHAMFVGLGQLPGNSWGITFSDADPLMREIVDRELGPDESTLGRRADALLKHEFRERVADRPVEFVHKMVHVGALVLTQGAYPGEFLNTATHRVRKDELKARCKQFLRAPLDYWQKYGFDQSLRTALMIGSYALTVFIVLGSFLVAPLNAWFGLSHRSLPVLLVLACIAYQLLLQMTVANMLQYTSCVLLFHIVNLGFAHDSWIAFRESALR